jgi:O-antigen/teichoic acid export membrane protein
MDPRQRIANGFLWLGSSRLVSQLTDTGSMIAVLWFVTREQMGLATLAWSIAVFLEALNGLGVGTAVLQAREVSARQLSSVFWYVTALAGGLFLIIALCSPLIARLYGEPSLTWMVVVASAKLPIVGAALVPLQLLNRKLKFSYVGTITAAATMLSGLVKVALAAAGLGAWALVLAHTSQGLFILIGVYLVAPYYPSLVFAFAEIRRMVVFGIKVATSGVIYHFYRNADFLLVGRFLGMDALGVYRVAFDLAMSPATSILAIVNRTALPVFARVRHDTGQLADTFLFTARSLALLVTGVLVVVWASADDLLLLLGQGQWLGAAPAVGALCAAAWLRCLVQLFPQLFHAAGRPEYAVYDSLLSLLVMLAAFTSFLSWWGERLGIVAVSYAWLACYPPLLGFLWLLARHLIPLTVRGYLRALLPAVGGAAVLVGPLWLLRRFDQFLQPGGQAFAVYVLVGVILYTAYLWVGLGITPRSLLASATGKAGS